MKYLLDTHTFLWAVFSPELLGTTASNIIRSADNQVFVSTTTFWEISIKYNLGKIKLDNCKPDDLPNIATQMQLVIIQPNAQEVASFYRLPKTSHKDPFDRMIIWQAIAQSLILLSKDTKFSDYHEYGLKTVW